MKKKIDQQKSQFLKLALQEVPFSGWTLELLGNIEGKMHLDPGYSLILFESGIKDLVMFYEQSKDLEMLDKLALNKDELRIRDKIALAVRTRLEISNKAVVEKLLKFYSHPLNMGLGLKSAWNTADKMWYFAGDESTDYNYYSKRLLLSGVYSSTLIYYISDDSKQNHKSWEFLDKRIASVLKIGNIKNIPKFFTKIKNKIPFIRLIK